MISIQNVQFSYKTNEALKGLSFEVPSGEIFGLLGPNGSGKTTLFRLLTTALEMQKGTISVGGKCLQKDVQAIREQIGVVFQSPSLDSKLTVYENMLHQGHLQGLRGKELKKLISDFLSRFGVDDRKKERVEKLSGGLKRRVELAKSLLHKPTLLILDEPSTGLDPGARADLWRHLAQLKKEGVTILLTTHLMEEAEHCDRLAIMNKGLLICEGKPEELKREVSKDVLIAKVKAEQSTSEQSMKEIAEKVREKLKAKVYVSEHTIQIEHENGAALVPKLIKEFPEAFEAVTFRRPSLEDVFLHHTGHSFWEEGEIDEIK